MTRFGYFLSSEEHGPSELVRQARLAEQAGFEALWISDHYHPWLDEQGESSFVWSVIGAISQVSSLPVTTAVTCPIMRIHPAVIAQAAAASAMLTKGKFILGVGTGEALNEYPCTADWPDYYTRRDMVRESIDLMRLLWSGDEIT
ncbi:MAG: TIGR03557 family F420-dependent LLM class oxidoreductase, partial [Micromonosporaceae bacterium]